MRTIAIRTTQNVLIDYELGTLGNRVMSYCLDLLILYSSLFFLVLIINPFAAILAAFLIAIFDDVLYVILFKLITLISYYLTCESLLSGQTLGKKILSLQVVRVDGREASFGDYFLRAIFLPVDCVMSFCVVASVLIASSDKRQRFGDMAANTTVVRKKARTKFLLEDILKIQTLDDYEVTYAEVRQLNEEDLLLIKNVVNRYEAYQNDSHREAVRDLVKKLTEILNLKETPKRPIQFLKTLIRDYIVLTR